jgi:hypothetical protein
MTKKSYMAQAMVILQDEEIKCYFIPSELAKLSHSFMDESKAQLFSLITDFDLRVEWLRDELREHTT